MFPQQIRIHTINSFGKVQAHHRIPSREDLYQSFRGVFCNTEALYQMDSQIRGRHSANISIRHLVQIARCRIAFKSWTMQFPKVGHSLPITVPSYAHVTTVGSTLGFGGDIYSLGSGHRSHVQWQCQTRMATTCMDHATPAEANNREMPGMIDQKPTMAKATMYVIAMFVLNRGNPLRMPPSRYILERLQGLDPTLHQKLDGSFVTFRRRISVCESRGSVQLSDAVGTSVSRRCVVLICRLCWCGVKDFWEETRQKFTPLQAHCLFVASNSITCQNVYPITTKRTVSGEQCSFVSLLL